MSKKLKLQKSNDHWKQAGRLLSKIYIPSQSYISKLRFSVNMTPFSINEEISEVPNLITKKGLEEKLHVHGALEFIA